MRFKIDTVTRLQEEFQECYGPGIKVIEVHNSMLVEAADEKAVHDLAGDLMQGLEGDGATSSYSITAVH